MLYIRKRKPSANILRKVAEVKGTKAWRETSAEKTEAIRAFFDTLPKEEIRHQLIEEQHGLRAYCMKSISKDSLHMKIEHWMPLSKDKEKALDYHNMLGTCFGGSDILVQGRTRRRNSLIFYRQANIMETL